jgi:hypothetical protein
MRKQDLARDTDPLKLKVGLVRDRSVTVFLGSPALFSRHCSGTGWSGKVASITQGSCTLDLWLELAGGLVPN